MSIKELMTRELIPGVDSIMAGRCVGIVMFAIGVFMLALGALKIPRMGLGAESLMIGWLMLAVVGLQCLVAGLLSSRYQLETGCLITGQVAWIFVGGALFVGTVLGLTQLEHITKPQLGLGCLLGVMLQMNCFTLGLLWSKGTKTDNLSDDE
ncbi:MAG: hypothetical protein QF685_03995 [Verrucomicrobiota bacterium]|jgi:hypothetical protein|nr:hypothetical protein [Verrucomicrobiota bacterium]